MGAKGRYQFNHFGFACVGKDRVRQDIVELFVSEWWSKIANSSGIKAKVVTIVKNPMCAGMRLLAAFNGLTRDIETPVIRLVDFPGLQGRAPSFRQHPAPWPWTGSPSKTPK